MVMELSLKKFKEEFYNDLLEIYWRHWTSVGVSSHVQPERYWIIDLEALIVSTLAIGLLDKRLLSVSLEWLAKNGHWINLSRLKRIVTSFAKPFHGSQEPLIVPEICELFIEKYNKFARSNMIHEERAYYGSGAKMLNEYKNIFNTFKPKGVVTEPKLQNPSLVQLLLRGTFGVDARAEILIYLLSHDSGNSNSIAKEIYYNQKNIYRILEQWTHSQMVMKISQNKTAKYSLQKKGELLRVIGLEKIPAYMNWVRTFLWLDQISKALSFPRWSESEYLLSSFFRDLLNAAKETGRTLNIIVPEPALYPGKEYFVPFALAVLEILKQLKK
jgi:predicted transcriptional regulator